MLKMQIWQWVLLHQGLREMNKGKILKTFKKLNDYKEAMVSMSKSNLIDIMLMSASVGEELINKESI